jgi:hypothetical protein
VFFGAHMPIAFWKLEALFNDQILAVGLSWDFFSYFSLIAQVMGRGWKNKLGQFYDMKFSYNFLSQRIGNFSSNLN